MIIHNRITNSLKLMEKVDLRGPMDLFMRSFSASTGFSLEVFRDGRHLASITPANTGRGDLHTLALASQALQVNLGPRIMKMSGQLPTQDTFTREYEMELRIHVSNSTQFATLYAQHSDPVALAQKAIESILINYAQSKRHDEIQSAALIELGRASFSAATQQRAGITIDEVLRVDVRLDPDHRQVANLGRTEMVERARLRQQASIAGAELDAQMPLQQRRDEHEFERTRRRAEQQIQLDAAQKRHEIEMDQITREHNRRQALQDAYAQGLRQMIANHLSSGYTLQELWDQFPELRPLLQSSVELQIEGHTEPQRLLPQFSGTEGTPQASGEPRALPASSGQTGEQSGLRVRARRRITEEGQSEVIEMQASSTPGFDAAYEPIIRVKQQRPGAPNTPETATPATPPAPPPDDPLALTIAVVPITNEPTVHVATTSSPISTVPSSLITGTSFHNDRLGVTLAIVTEEERRVLQLDERIVFSVQSVDVGSPAQRASMMRSDFLVEINHQPVTDIQSLLSRLEESTDGMTIAIRVLRMGQLLNLPETPVKKEE